MLEHMDRPVDQVTDHHELSSCHSRILGQKVPDPWNLAGQVAIL